jgi:hypothetical protein
MTPLLAALPVAAWAAALAAAEMVLPGHNITGHNITGSYTNEEQVEFARDQGQPLPQWMAIEVTDGEHGPILARVDAFGQPVEQPLAPIISSTADSLTVQGEDGTALQLLRARSFRCWASMPKQAAKPDGSPDWWFKAGLPMHDRGGRLRVETGEPGSPVYTLRMRNVVFPDPPNRPSLVLYVHAQDPVRAVSYSWADPDATRLGINLRTMQASCTLEDINN